MGWNWVYEESDEEKEKPEQISIANHWQLSKYLESKLGEDLKLDSGVLLFGGLEGTYKGQSIKITFGPSEYLLVTVAADHKKLLDELVQLLSKVMKGKKPICYYEMKNEGEDKGKPTLEWDIKNPKARLIEIANGRAYEKCQCENIKLFNRKKLENYIETEEMKQERIKNAKQFGVYPGAIKEEDVASFDTCSELKLYRTIDALGYYMWWSRHEASHGNIEHEDLTEYQYAIEYLVLKTARFGVDVTMPPSGEHVKNTPSYQAWYSWWDNYVKHELDEKQYRDLEIYEEHLEKEIKANEGISPASYCYSQYFRPAGDWRDSLKQEQTQNTLKKQ